MSTKEVNVIQNIPMITSFSLSSTNKDESIEMQWESANANMYRLYINNMTYPIAETSNTVYTPKPKFLKLGLNTFKIIPFMMNTEPAEENAYIEKINLSVANMPVITSLEPSNMNQNIEQPILITFATNEFVTEWELKIGKKIYSGTIDRSLTLPPNTCIAGINTITLTVWNNPSGQDKTVFVSKSVTFEGFGAPLAPTLLEVEDVYATSKISLKWDTQEDQKAFKVRVSSNGEIFEDVTRPYEEMTYNIDYIFINNRSYTIELAIQNKYSIWSNYASHSFEVIFPLMPAPALRLASSGMGEQVQVLISWIKAGEDLEDADGVFSRMQLFRKEESKWIQISDGLPEEGEFTDNTPMNGYSTYKGRYVYSDNSYAESMPVSIMIKLPLLTLTDVESDTSIPLNHSSVDTNKITTQVIKKFAGSKLPVVYTNGLMYETGVITAHLVDKDAENLIKIIDAGKLCWIRDNRGKKLSAYVTLISDNYANPWWHTVKLSYVETEVKEESHE